MCKYAYIPKSKVKFWNDKFRRNIERHDKVAKQLEQLRWRVLTVWECELANTSELRETLAKWLPVKG